MEILTTQGTRIDVSPWVDQMKENYSSGDNILQQTPIGTTADKGYFWWDEEGNPDLDKQSVKALIKTIKRLAKGELEVC